MLKKTIWRLTHVTCLERVVQSSLCCLKTKWLSLRWRYQALFIKYWRIEVIDVRIVYFDYIHVCFNLGMMSSVCWVDTGKCQNIGRVEVWLSDGATHCHTEFWSDILFTGRAESSLVLLLCDCTRWRCCVSVSCNWQDPDLIDNIIILHTMPGPGDTTPCHGLNELKHFEF